MGYAITIISILVLTGCDETGGLWVDSSFTQGEREAIETAVDALNEAAGEEIVFIAGETDDIGDNTGSDADDMDIVVKATDATEYPWLAPRVGSEWLRDIYISVQSLSPENLQQIMMHELMHYIGIPDDVHSQNPADIFYTYFRPQTSPSYTPADIALITAAVHLSNSE